MSKEDRYAHLGDSTEGTTDEPAEETDGSDRVSVTIDDGEEETVLTFDPEEVSADDLRAALERAIEGEGEPLFSGDPGLLAFELGTLGPRLALRSAESMMEGLRVDRRRD